MAEARGDLFTALALTRRAADSQPEVRPQLARLLVRLDQAMAGQRRFIADAAHELRTPLTAVKLQAQIARRAETGMERDAALVQLADGVDRAAHLVDQLLGMARLEPEARQVTFTPVQMDALVKRAVADFSAQADARGIDLGVGACEPLKLVGQAESLRMMLGNLLDNALSYTPAGGRVDVELRASAGNAFLTVADNGPGIPASERARVFERFQRLAGADIPGSGLGLAIVKQVVAMHGGEVRLGDAASGGLLVEVQLPLA
jgi:two-component system OmpR family sensor kinase